MPAVNHMVATLCDDDHSVAQTAYELLRTQQNEWSLLDRDETIVHHMELVRAMNNIAGRITEDRTGWPTSLLQQSISTSVDRADDASQRLYAAATQMLDRMSLSEQSGPSILVRNDDEFDTPRRLVVRTEPLPVSPSESIEGWTQWPPRADDTDATEREPASPTVYRSAGMRLQPVPDNETFVLSPVPEPATAPIDDEPIASAMPQPANSVAQDTPGDIRPVNLLVDSPLATYDTKSVIYWLGNSHPPLRAAAKTELTRRGLSESQIAIATRIAAGDLQTKLDLVDMIAGDTSADPRPWLLLLLKDPSRDVKLRAVSVLATFKDPAIQQELETHLLDEPDPTVAFRIRRLLDLR